MVDIEKVKSWVELCLEVGGVSGGVGYGMYRFEVLQALWRVSRGRAASVDEELALEALGEGGAAAQKLVKAVAQKIQKNHPDEAARLDNLRRQLKAHNSNGRARGEERGESSRQAPSRDLSPGQMV